MACNKCKLVKCGCRDSYLTTPPPCPDPGDCPEAQPCSEVFDAQCVVYTGNDISCGQDVLITSGNNLSAALESVTNYFCTQDVVNTDITCGEDTVVVAGTSINDALNQITAYFCGQIPDLCASPISEAPNDTTNFIVCQGGNVNQISYAGVFGQIENDLAIPVSNAFGLFTQIGNSIPVTSGAGSIIGAGIPVAGLTVPANTFKIGDSYRLSMHGHVSCDPNQDINITVRSTGASPVVLAQTGIVTLPATSDEHFEVKIDFTIRALGDLVGPAFGSVASAGQFTYTKTASGDFGGVGFSQIVNLDTTVANTLSIEAEWITGGGGNSIYTELLTLSKMY